LSKYGKSKKSEAAEKKGFQTKKGSCEGEQVCTGKERGENVRVQSEKQDTTDCNVQWGNERFKRRTWLGNPRGRGNLANRSDANSKGGGGRGSEGEAKK